MPMRACTRCGYPVRVKDQVPDPNDDGRVMHKSDCPVGLGGEPDPHKGRTFDAFQRQLKAADLCNGVRVTVANIKTMAEEARLGSPVALDAVKVLERQVSDLRFVVELAVASRSRKDER